jgi:hypothetical protein
MEKAHAQLRILESVGGAQPLSEAVRKAIELLKRGLDDEIVKQSIRLYLVNPETIESVMQSAHEQIANGAGSAAAGGKRGGVLTAEDRRKHAEHMARLKGIRDAATRHQEWLASFEEPAAPEQATIHYGPARPTTGALAKRFEAYGYGKGMTSAQYKKWSNSLSNVPPPPEHPIIARMRDEYRTTPPEYKAERDAREKRTEDERIRKDAELDQELADADLYEAYVRQANRSKKRRGKGPPKYTQLAKAVMVRNMRDTERQTIAWLRTVLRSPNVTMEFLTKNMDEMIVPREKQEELINRVIAELQV